MLLMPRRLLIAALGVGFVTLILWFTFPKIQPYEIVFRAQTKIMSKAQPENWNGDSTSTVLEVAEIGSTAQVTAEWQAKKFPVYKVKTAQGTEGFVLSEAAFAKKTVSP